VRYQDAFFSWVNNKLLNVINYRFGLRRVFEHRPGTEVYKGRGYVAIDIVMSERQIMETATSPVTEMHNWQMAPRQAYYLDKIVDLCREEGISLLLVTAPVSNVQFDRIRNYGDFHRAIAEYAARHNLPYLDFNMINAEKGLFGDEHFYDAGHLNDQGAKIANAYYISTR
jgi:hypothetical protein